MYLILGGSLLVLCGPRLLARGLRALGRGAAGLVAGVLYASDDDVYGLWVACLPRRARAAWSRLGEATRWYLVWTGGLLGFVLLSVSVHLLCGR